MFTDVPFYRLMIHLSAALALANRFPSSDNFSDRLVVLAREISRAFGL
jgi:hypothetical protein